MNQTTIAPAPVRKTLTLACAPEKAFQVFTDGFDRWWPRGDHIGKAEMARAVIEPRTGGRWYEAGVDGSECQWGEVLVWEPPARLVLAWRINAQWTYDPDAFSEVEVTFTALPEGGTRMDFEHRKIEGLGANAQQMRDGVDGPQGWGALLEGFKAAAEAG